MESSRYCLGLDYGTNTARALIVDVRDGSELAGGVAPYPSGEEGILADASDPLLARQCPLDSGEVLISATREALAPLAKMNGRAAASSRIGIGIGAPARARRGCRLPVVCLLCYLDIVGLFFDAGIFWCGFVKLWVC